MDFNYWIQQKKSNNYKIHTFQNHFDEIQTFREFNLI